MKVRRFAPEKLHGKSWLLLVGADVDVFVLGAGVAGEICRAHNVLAQIFAGVYRGRSGLDVEVGRIAGGAGLGIGERRRIGVEAGLRAVIVVSGIVLAFPSPVAVCRAHFGIVKVIVDRSRI